VCVGFPKTFESLTQLNTPVNVEVPHNEIRTAIKRHHSSPLPPGKEKVLSLMKEITLFLLSSDLGENRYFYLYFISCQREIK
jgi:hypothetical protein